MNTPISISLYKLCLLTIIKNSTIQAISFLPEIILNEVKQLQSLHASWNDRKVKYNRHFSAIKAVLDLTWETLTCYECEHNPAWPDQSGYCFRHSSLIDYELEIQKDLKLESFNAATMYIKEKDRVCSIFPQFQDIVENLEGGATFDVDLWEAI